MSPVGATFVPFPPKTGTKSFYTRPPQPLNGSLPLPLAVLYITCLGVGACLKVNTRALGRGALHKKNHSVPLLLTSEEVGLL